ncbi:MAG TPA: septum formation inhibitor Maf, partial [Bdellovibrionales bacterium]|nr:septum formation inhibitor Maf [Bdellovibrionales bacterium]
LLEQAGFQFEVIKSSFDEDAYKTSHTDLSPRDLCLEMAQGKAQFGMIPSPEAAFVIGSDQLIELENEILGKPGTFENAKAQLQKLSGKSHWLHTSLCLMSPEKELFKKLCSTKITLRPLNFSEIEAYLNQDQPLNCAGSYKMECAGLLLASDIQGSDPSAIQGLSLMDLSHGLQHFGYSPFDFGGLKK